MLRFLKKVFEHKIFVSVAFTETGAVRGTRVHSAALVSGALTVCICFCYLAFFGGGRELMGELRDLASTKQQLAIMEDQEAYRREQFKIIAQEMGIMQARLDRFDVIGERLFRDEDIGKQLEKLDGAGGKGGPVEVEEFVNVSLEEIQNQMALLSKRVEKSENVMQAGLELLIRRQKDNLMQPHLWPVVHERSRVSSTFGWREDPFNKKKKWHGGTDFAAGWNAPIVATSDGIVTFAGYRGAYGVLVEIRHPGGFETRYGRLAKATVRNGQRVKAGELIGLMGSSGRSTGPHLHLEVLIDGSKVNPYPFVRDGKAFAQQQAKTRKFNVANVRTK